MDPEENAAFVNELIRASVLGGLELASRIRAIAPGQKFVRHGTGIRICVCCEDYALRDIPDASIRALNVEFSPVCGPWTVFGTTEEWSLSAGMPVKRVIFMMSSQWDIVAYVNGLLYYLAPSMSDFWDCAIVFEYENALFPSSVKREIKQYATCLDDLILFHRHLRAKKCIADAAKLGFREGLMLKDDDKLYSVLAAADSSLSVGKIPDVFIDEGVLQRNVDARFYPRVAAWIRETNRPYVDEQREALLEKAVQIKATGSRE